MTHDPPSTPDAELHAIRARIDALDEQIQALISERAHCALQIGELKKQQYVHHQQVRRSDFYRPEREAQVLRKVADRNRGPLSDPAMMRLFREIMSACLALEEPLKVAFLGPEGTFTQAAALKHFGQAIQAIPLLAISAVFREVEAGTADYGVVPVENSTEGVVSHTLDMFLHSDLKICGEVQLRIHHYLMSRETNLARIQKIYSHPQSFAQCRQWLLCNLPHAQQVPVSSNGTAACLVQEEPGCAAIAGQCAADIYQLPILAGHIEDEPTNTTRFLIIGHRIIPPSGRDKTTILIASADQPGALVNLLVPLGRHGLNMTRIESRPSGRGMWNYVFFIDLEGHADDPAVATALAELKTQASLFRILGSYPIGVL